MAIDFFEKEVSKVHQRFNQTFGETQVINLSTRFNVILSIINLGLVAKELNNKNKRKDIEKIKEFMRIKEILNKVFDSAQKLKYSRKEKNNDEEHYAQNRNAMSNAG